MIYLITYKNYLESVEVCRFGSETHAASELLRASDDPAKGGFVVNTESNLADLGARLMIDLFNLWRDPEDKQVSKFENRSIARQRFIARLEARFSTLPEIEAPEQSKEVTVANQAAAKKMKVGRAPGNGRTISKPVGLVGDFKQIRNGTDRQRVLKMMDGTKTVSMIAKAMEKDEKTILMIAYCLNRDSAIGYRVEDGKIVASYPGSKTYADAIKPTAE